MTTSNYSELLTVALQDLREARRVTAGRLPDILAATRDPGTEAVFQQVVDRADTQLEILAEILSDPEGEPNLWAAGIMDDASRDVASTKAGPPRDVALIGAVRKFLAADIVSLETAIALDRYDEAKHAEELEKMRQEACELNRHLRLRLVDLTRHSAAGA